MYVVDDYPECVNLSFLIEEKEIPIDSIKFDNKTLLKGVKNFQIS